MVDGGEVGKVGWERGWRGREIARREVSMVIGSGTAAMVANSEVFGAVKVANKTFEVSVMELGRMGGKLGKGHDGIGNIQTT